MKRPSADHVQRVLRRERDLEAWLFAPHRDEQERAQTRRAMTRLIRQSEPQPELPLEQTPR